MPGLDDVRRGFETVVQPAVDIATEVASGAASAVETLATTVLDLLGDLVTEADLEALSDEARAALQTVLDRFRTLQSARDALAQAMQAMNEGALRQEWPTAGRPENFAQAMQLMRALRGAQEAVRTTLAALAEFTALLPGMEDAIRAAVEPIDARLPEWLGL